MHLVTRFGKARTLYQICHVTCCHVMSRDAAHHSCIHRWSLRSHWRHCTGSQSTDSGCCCTWTRPSRTLAQTHEYHQHFQAISSYMDKWLIPLQKWANGIPLITIKYHSLSFSTIGPFYDISVGLSGTLNGNIKYLSVPLNGTKNPKYNSNNIQIPFKYPWP